MVTSVAACSMGVVLYYWLVLRWCCPDLDPIAACLLGVALLSKLSLGGGRDDRCGGLDCCSVVCVYLNMRGSMLARDIDGFGRQLECRVARSADFVSANGY